MSVQSDKLPPVPVSTPFDEGAKQPTSIWAQWFIRLKAKVDVITASIVALSGGAVAGFLTSDGAGGINARTLVGGTGITITNPTGATGNPTINASSTGGNPMEVTTNTAISYIVPLTAAPAGTGNVGWVDSNNASTNYIQIDVNANQAFPIGTSLFVRQLGAGQTNLEALTGVTFQGSPTAGGQYAVGRLVQIAINTWAVFGNLATVIPSYATVILADGPVGYWHLGETSGTVAADSSGNSHNGTYAGTYTLGNASLLPHGYGACAQSAGAIYITLTSGWISGISSNITFEAWIKPESFAGYPAIFDGGDQGFIFQITTSGYLTVEKQDVAFIATDTTLLSIGTIYYVAATWSSTGTVNFYINGVLSSTHTGVGSPPAGIDPPTIASGMHSGSPSNLWTGYIQEVTIYNKVLTATQIANHYAAG